jgi:hypothetical protein
VARKIQGTAARNYKADWLDDVERLTSKASIQDNTVAFHNWEV